ncbi:MAG: HDOD domain-containing protein [Leptospirillia bacterium]
MSSDPFPPIPRASSSRPPTDRLFERLSSIDHLPTLPAISQKALSYLEDPDLSMVRLSKIIEEDQSMASRILKLANSPYYSRSGKVGSIREAVLLLGINGIRGLILSMAVFDQLESRRGTLKLWKHSFAVSVLSRMIGESLQMGAPEDLGTAGLLHDFGKVIFYLDFEEWMPDVFDRDQNVPDWRFEEDFFGASHAFVGFRLSYFWRFPSSIRIPIGWHNNPARAPSFQLEAAIISLADGLATMAGFGLEEAPTPDFTMMDALRVLKISDGRLEEIFKTLLEGLPKLELPDL